MLPIAHKIIEDHYFPLIGLKNNQRAMHYLRDMRNAHHNPDHVLHILENMRRMNIVSGYISKQIMIAAAIFHDIIYVPGATDNEERSAQIAMDILSNSKSNYPKTFIKHVTDIILDTRTHESTTYLGKVFSDLDMMILAENNLLYLTYAKNIRVEFSKTSWEDYRVGRVKFLHSMLQRDMIFHYFPDCDLRAKGNMVAEADLLLRLTESEFLATQCLSSETINTTIKRLKENSI